MSLRDCVDLLQIAECEELMVLVRVTFVYVLNVGLSVQLTHVIVGRRLACKNTVFFSDVVVIPKSRIQSMRTSRSNTRSLSMEVVLHIFVQCLARTCLVAVRSCYNSFGPKSHQPAAQRDREVVLGNPHSHPR